MAWTMPAAQRRDIALRRPLHPVAHWAELAGSGDGTVLVAEQMTTGYRRPASITCVSDSLLGFPPGPVLRPLVNLDGQGANVKHPHGTFCWMDIYLPDQDRGKAFYGGLFGWEWADVPMGDSGMLYTMFNLDGKAVGAMGPAMPGMLPEGVPPHWLSYIATDDLDGTAETARSLGAKFMMGPQDVGNGRVALMQDPAGASVFLWQALEFAGAEIVRTHGAMAWNELYTRDLEATKAFYSGLFGWEWGSMPIPQGGDYHLASADDYLVCGVLEMDENWGEIPPHWMVYIQVDDADEAADRVTALGGDVCVPVTEIAVGRFAVVNDDQKGTFTIFEVAG